MVNEAIANPNLVYTLPFPVAEPPADNTSIIAGASSTPASERRK